MKKINFFDGFSSETQPTIGSISSSALVQYASTAAFEAVYGTGIEGSIMMNTTTHLINYHNGTSWVEMDVTEWDAAYSHVSNNGSDHSYIDQSVTTTATPTFSTLALSSTTESTDKDTGCLVVEGGVGVEKSLNVGGDVEITGNLTVQGTTTTINTTNLEVEDANITVNNGGTESTANTNKAGLTVEMSDATDAVIGFDSSLTSKFKCGVSGSEVEIADVSSAQNISGKSIQTPTRLDIKQDTAANLTTYAGSASNGQLCWATDTKKIYCVKDSALLELGFQELGDLTNVDLTSTAPESGNALVYDGSNWVPGEGSGGSGSGGGSQYSDIYCAEAINGSTGNPVAVALSQKRCLEISADNSWIDIDEGGGEVSTQIWSTDTKPWFIYDLNFPNTSEDAYNLTSVIETALNANASLSETYTVSFSETTRKITIAATDNFSILHNTGTHTGVGNICNYLSFDTSADDSVAATYEADYTITASTNTAYVKRAFVSKTDSSLLIKSRNFDGFVTENIAKGATTTVSQFTELDSFTGLQSGDEYYTQSSAIVIDSTNKYIDFNPNSAGEVNATLTEGTYYRGSDSAIGYKALCDHIKSVMDTADGVNTYTVVFNKNTQKFSITGSAVWVWMLATGTNTANNAGEILGFDDSADTSSATTQTSGSVIPNATGLIGGILDTSTTAESVYVGKGIKGDGTTLFTEKNFTVSDYDPILNSPNDFMATPLEKDTGLDILFQHQHENRAGYGCRLYMDNVTTDAYYKFQYKKPNGVWVDATTTVHFYLSGTAAYNSVHTNAYFATSRVFVDENNRYIAALYRNNPAAMEPLVACFVSNDEGDTWTELTDVATQLSNGVSAGFYVGGLYAREGKAIILGKRRDNAVSKMCILDDSGSSYAYTSVVTLANPLLCQTQQSACYIQYFPAETGINKHRLIVLGSLASNSYLYAHYYKGDGSSASTVEIFATAMTSINTFCIDQAGLKNRLAVFAVKGSAVYEAESNEDYNAGVLTTNSHSGQDLNSGGSAGDCYNGSANTNGETLNWNVETRAILAGDFCALISMHDANPSSAVAAMLFYTKNVTGGTWETPLNIGDSASGDNCQEVCMQYIPASEGFLIAWKYNSAAITANLTNGIIKARYVEILQDNDINMLETEVIDGGEAMSGFQGYLTMSASNDTVSLTWSRYDGSARNLLVTNQFI